MEQMYHELEISFFDLRKSLLSQTQEIENLKHELQEERTRKSELSVQLITVSHVQDELLRIQKEQSGSGNVVTQLKLEIQQLREEALLTNELNNSRQSQIDVLHSQLQETTTKWEEVEFVQYGDKQAAKRELSLQSELGQAEGMISSIKIQLSAAVQHRDVAVSLYHDSKLKVHQSQVLNTTIADVQSTLEKERITYRNKEEQWNREISMLTSARNTAETTITQLQQQLQDLNDHYTATQQDLESTTREFTNLKAHTQVVLQEHLRLESL